MENIEKAATHDLGGRNKYLDQPIDRNAAPIPPTEFARRVDALRLLMGEKKLMSTDEFRRHIEEMSPEEYHQVNYYERWLRSMALMLKRQGLIDEGTI
ncbi:nitrile hydratase subunit beta [Agrobacterium rubi]|uniref:SH3-like domain-containing protein n=1 Tax=Agrobacterium rubi TaxID=28099 RepID=UPI0015718CDA|nr:SH3-like domain-containing protein [Agrobacterium rubi]NTF10482.1 nitrile hydratase subunit beta [Agrobacterium rubi]NTF22876.1 nitrile hydratase subunit beta [Agrobacterium rubi]NTF29807.1 nitrile hydratase subunit beta [Agrobacterium rubi]